MTRGRPSKYKPETVKRILDGIRVGATLHHAAAAGGINYDTLNEWRKKYSDFSDDIKKAEGECVVMRLARINKAGQEGTWQADAWTLERRYPQDYGRTIQEHQGKDGEPIAVKLIEVIRNKSGDSNG